LGVIASAGRLAELANRSIGDQNSDIPSRRHIRSLRGNAREEQTERSMAVRNCASRVRRSAQRSAQASTGTISIVRRSNESAKRALSRSTDTPAVVRGPPNEKHLRHN